MLDSEFTSTDTLRQLLYPVFKRNKFSIYLSLARAENYVNLAERW